MSRIEWNAPILDDHILIKARLKIDEITENLLSFSSNQLPGSLMSAGSSGLALYYYYMYKVTKHSFFLNLTNKQINDSLKYELENRYIPTLCDGYLGPAWLMSHIQNEEKDLSQVFENALVTIDSRCVRDAKIFLKDHRYDYMHGGLGCLIYIFERNNITNRESLVLSLIEDLRSFAIEDDSMICWRSVSSTVTDKNDTHENKVNLGLSHGMPSIIHLLIKSYNKQIGTQVCKEIITKAIKWLLNQKNSISSISKFPTVKSINDDGSDFEYSRLGWCYGDLGIATVLYQSGVAFNNKSWLNEGVSLAKKTLNRLTEHETLVNDATFCHGSIGVAHMYNRFYHYTGYHGFKLGANLWYSRTLDTYTNPEGLAGYKFYNGVDSWENSTALLDGIAGIGLSLISAVYGIEPKWDRIFLLS